MRQIINYLDDPTGLAVTGSVTLNTNGVSDFAAYFRETSVIAHFQGPGDISESFTPMEGAQWVTLWLRSFNNAGNYVMHFDGSASFPLSIKTTFAPYIFPVDNEVISGWRLEKIDSMEDHVIISSLVASFDEFPLDVESAIAESLQFIADEDLSNRPVPLGPVSIDAGSKNLEFTSGTPEWANRYAVIKVGTHRFQLVDGGGDRWKIGQMYDGPTSPITYVDEPGYLYYPAGHGSQQQEVPIPSVFVSPQDVGAADIGLDGEIYSGNVETLSGDYRSYFQSSQEFFTMKITAIAHDLYTLFRLRDYIDAWGSRHAEYINGAKVPIYSDMTYTTGEFTQAYTPIFTNTVTVQIPIRTTSIGPRVPRVSGQNVITDVTLQGGI